MLTEGNALTEHVNIDSDERRQTSGEQQIEAGHPTTDHSAFLQALLSKLSDVEFKPWA